MKRLNMPALLLLCLFALLPACPPPDDGDSREETILLPGDVPLTMVWIEPGTFMMGRSPGEVGASSMEAPQHEVTLTRGFWLGRFEVTRRQWQAITGDDPWMSWPVTDPNLDCPVTGISLEDIDDFLAALNASTGLQFRLPTEAEWEYSCRAGSATRFYWGDDPDLIEIGYYAWWARNSGDGGEPYPHVVGRKLPNAWGLYDMTGNVWEWTSDWLNPYQSGPVTDPSWPDSGMYRMPRGGSWAVREGSCRSAFRYDYPPPYASDRFGLRLCR